MRTQNIIHEGTFRPDQEKTYIHLPFEVPTGATRLQIEYDYSNQIRSSPLLRGGNTIDLGVFDSRGIRLPSCRLSWLERQRAAVGEH